MSRRRTRFEIMRRNRQCIQFAIGRAEADVAWADHCADLLSDREADGKDTEAWIKETMDMARKSAARGQPIADFHLIPQPRPGLLRRFLNWITSRGKDEWEF